MLTLKNTATCGILFLGKGQRSTEWILFCFKFHHQLQVEAFILTASHPRQRTDLMGMTVFASVK